MDVRYAELLAFHTEAQQGLYLDEVIPVARGAGVAMFSSRECDPSWNAYGVVDLNASLRHEPVIRELFTRRQRMDVWMLREADAERLENAQGFSSDAWMVRRRMVSIPSMPREWRFSEVSTAAEAHCFDRLYLAAFWGDSPEPGAILPIAGRIDGASVAGMRHRHWLGWLGEVPVAQVTTVSRQGWVAVYDVGTRPDFRGQGFGLAALTTALARESADGAGLFFLTTERDMPDLEVFYCKAGFEILDRCQYLSR